MMFNSCYYPEPCDCLNCESRSYANRVTKIKSEIRKLTQERKELKRDGVIPKIFKVKKIYLKV